MITTKRQMQDLCEGDTFYVNGEQHTAAYDAGLCGDASCEEYVVYDENGESWFESDFPESEEEYRQNTLIRDKANKFDMLMNWVCEHSKNTDLVCDLLNAMCFTKKEAKEYELEEVVAGDKRFAV